jgi:hypothetical protein
LISFFQISAIFILSVQFPFFINNRFFSRFINLLSLFFNKINQFPFDTWYLSFTNIIHILPDLKEVFWITVIIRIFLFVFFYLSKCALPSDSSALQLPFIYNNSESVLTEVFFTGNIYLATCNVNIWHWDYVHRYRPPILSHFDGL